MVSQEPSVRLWQVPASAIAESEWDVAIVGCGPAGAVAATELARRGVRVVALERHRFPREKMCGDALIPDARRALERLGLLAEDPREVFSGSGIWSMLRG